MSQPPGFVNEMLPNHVCRLHKAIYGLKQAPRAWYEQLKSYLLSVRFYHSQCDHCLFTFTMFGIIIYLIVYVDDIIITGNNSHHVEDNVTRLGRRFSIKDLGGLNFFLGVEVVRTPTGLFLNRKKYIYEILERTNMIDAKPMRTPTASGSCLRLDDGHPLNDPKKYQNIVGSLQYLLLTWPDVAFIVNKLSQFTSSPTTAHWALVKPD